MKFRAQEVITSRGIFLNQVATRFQLHWLGIRIYIRIYYIYMYVYIYIYIFIQYRYVWIHTQASWGMGFKLRGNYSHGPCGDQLVLSLQIRLMVQTSGDHHLGCIKPVVNNGIFTIYHYQTGAGFLYVLFEFSREMLCLTSWIDASGLENLLMTHEPLKCQVVDAAKISWNDQTLWTGCQLPINWCKILSYQQYGDNKP